MKHAHHIVIKAARIILADLKNPVIFFQNAACLRQAVSHIERFQFTAELKMFRGHSRPTFTNRRTTTLHRFHGNGCYR